MSVDAVVIGYGPVGATVTDQLLRAGNQVRLVTRSGSGPKDAEKHPADMTDLAQAAEALGDAPAIYHCGHAPYSAQAWREVLPKMQSVVLSHAAQTNAVVVMPENLYALDASDVMTPTTARRPVSKKGQVRAELLAARDRATIAVRSVAAGDFYGPRVLESHAGERLVKQILLGKAIQPVGNPDAPHAFTYMPDLAAAMIKSADLPGAGHEFLFAPNAGSISIRRLAEITAVAAGKPTPKISPYGKTMLNLASLFSSQIREINEMAYQFTDAFEVDASRDMARLDLQATPWPEAAQATVAWWKEQLTD